jgi:hypothetical protein
MHAEIGKGQIDVSGSLSSTMVTHTYCAGDLEPLELDRSPWTDVI